MRRFRKQLIDLLERARKEQKIERMPPRLAASLVQDFSTLLPLRFPQTNVEMRSRMLSHGDLHRHVITFRCPDQAFFLDAIKGYLQRRRIQPLMQQMLVLGADCDARGCLLELHEPGKDPEQNFMFVALHLSATLVADAGPLIRDIRAILQAVGSAVKDFEAMQTCVTHAAMMMEGHHAEVAALLDWLNDNHYIYFGLQTRQHRFGLMRNRGTMQHIVPGLAEAIRQVPEPETPGAEWLHLECTFNHLYAAATVELFRIAWQEPGKRILSWAIVLGHFSRTARYTGASRLPVLDHLWAELAEAPAVRHSAFYHRELRMVFDRIPKSALLATPVTDWLLPIKAVVDISGPTDTVCELICPRLGEQRILFVAMSADRFGPDTLKHLLHQLHESHGLSIHGKENFGVGLHELLLIYVDGRVDNGHPLADISIAAIRETVHNSVIFWRDQAKAEILLRSRQLDLPAALAELEAVPELYMDLFPPTQFLEDLKVRKDVLSSGRIRVRVRLQEAGVELHIISPQALTLGDLVDQIRSFGLIVEQESAVAFGSSSLQVHISSLQCQTPPMDSRFEGMLRLGLERVLNGEADHDALNRLLILAGQDIDHVAVAITLRNYLVQLMAAAAPLPLTEMLTRHAGVTAALMNLFAARHAPELSDDAITQAQEGFDRALETVQTLTHDTWFRALADIVNTSLRTNAFVRVGADPVAIKIAPRRLAFVPQPKPWREIFVHGVFVEGVHLRDGPIARGGIRWSDRHADFRTEVLELMATQTIKNGQIVPTGAKGGFVVRNGGGPGFVLQQYRIFIRTLLSMTDTLVDGSPVSPVGLRIAHEDEGDPYLVVAADKGTARFSDDANEEARRAHFWLDDAFASGGRYGYDHKAVGITARGAWICTAHHFARLGQDAYHDPIRIIGIGDMSGDVFGNGMLLNPNVRLIGAFNHQHIFLDPDPDPAKSFLERQRLFAAATGWDSYDKRLISHGGGVFERTAKNIQLSDEARTALDIGEQMLSGEGVIRAMLQAPVGLLYNGGIGTYVKARRETHADVRDPANNAVRVNADELRCRVVCEGGNLGFTQSARMEFAEKGGTINIDAMDNSAAVDMSDHEVNIKILFTATPAGKIGIRQRNRILEDLTGEVTAQCLDDCLMQSRALTLAELIAREHPHRVQRLMRLLQDAGWLDATVAASMKTPGHLQFRPLLAVLLGQEKNRLRTKLAEEHFHQDSCFSADLLDNYFPIRIRRRFRSQFAAHPLADEIVHTQTANHVVNHLGLTAVIELQTLLDSPLGDIVEALLISEALLDGGELRTAIWQNVGDVNAAAVMQRKLQEHVVQFAEDLLRLCPVGEFDNKWLKQQRQAFRHFRRAMLLKGTLPLESPNFGQRTKAFVQAGLPEADARHLAVLPELSQFACGVHLSTVKGISLLKCLHACQAGLELLPFARIEGPLRSPDWSDDETHKLRRDLLHRFTLQKSRAIGVLLDSKARNLKRAGEKLWRDHHYWPFLQAFGRGEDALGADADAEMRRMHLLLVLMRLDSVIENS